MQIPIKITKRYENPLEDSILVNITGMLNGLEFPKGLDISKLRHIETLLDGILMMSVELGMITFYNIMNLSQKPFFIPLLHKIEQEYVVNKNSKIVKNTFDYFSTINLLAELSEDNGAE